ncbi:rCG62030 [Rattus norvegicus]|uniref:RCG62030 n=1 Tax=Rattus norvegicus TaxID=10116 RepID=A6HBC9_RAT|nr:rCG62030 [Rattus norvegicus]
MTCFRKRGASKCFGSSIMGSSLFACLKMNRGSAMCYWLLSLTSTRVSQVFIISQMVKNGTEDCMARSFLLRRVSRNMPS